MTRWTPFVLLASLLMAACGDSPTAPDDTATTTTTVSPTVFEGTLGERGEILLVQRLAVGFADGTSRQPDAGRSP